MYNMLLRGIAIIWLSTRFTYDVAHLLRELDEIEQLLLAFTFPSINNMIN